MIRATFSAPNPSAVSSSIPFVPAPAFDRVASDVLLDELHRRLSRLRAHGAIEHDPAGIALDDRQVPQSHHTD